MLLGHILPERVFRLSTQDARLNQQTQGAGSPLAGKQKIAQIAAAQQRQIIMKLQPLRIPRCSPLNSAAPASRTSLI